MTFLSLKCWTLFKNAETTQQFSLISSFLKKELFSCKRRCATFAKYSQEPMVQFSTIVFCVQELSSIAKRNKQEGF